MAKKMDLRKEAKGRECTIRIPNVCNGINETVVLCHLNRKSLFGAGVGLKAPDIFGAWGCSNCHDAVDNRGAFENMLSRDETEKMHMEGVFRTQNQLLKEGKIGSK